jgi:hypothetical protein
VGDDVVQAAADGWVAQFEQFGHVFEATGGLDEFQYEGLVIGAEAGKLRQVKGPFYLGLAIGAGKSLDMQLLVTGRTLGRQVFRHLDTSQRVWDAL